MEVQGGFSETELRIKTGHDQPTVVLLSKFWRELFIDQPPRTLAQGPSAAQLSPCCAGLAHRGGSERTGASASSSLPPHPSPVSLEPFPQLLLTASAVRKKALQSGQLPKMSIFLDLPPGQKPLRRLLSPSQRCPPARGNHTHTHRSTSSAPWFSTSLKRGYSPANGHGVSFWEWWKCSRIKWWWWLHAMCEDAKIHWLIHLKMVQMMNFMGCAFYLVKA